MEKDIKNWYGMSDSAILEVLGVFIQQSRLKQNKTQQEVSKLAGLNRSTMVQIENGGGGTLTSFIQILRGLKQLHLLKHFEIMQQISPMQLAKTEMNKRKRASSKNGSDNQKQSSSW